MPQEQKRRPPAQVPIERKDGSLYDDAGGVAMQAAQAAAAQPARVVPKVGSEHTEPAAIARAAANPLSPIAIYSTNPFCRGDSADCLDTVQQEPGSQTVGPQGRETVALGDLQPGYRVAVTGLLPIRDELYERAGRLSPAAQRVLSVAVVQRSLSLLRQSAERDEMRRPVADLAPEGLAVAWAVCAGAPAGGDVADRLRAYGPSDPGDPILFDDRSVLAFVQDLPDLIDEPGLCLAGVAELLFSRNLRDFPDRPYSSGELREVAAQAFEIEMLEREPVTPELIERIREHATAVGEDLGRPAPRSPG